MTMLLQIERLTKRFGSLVAVDNIDFILREGETKALIGPNGAGKTTLLSLICGQLKPSNGRIMFHGEDLTRLAPHQITRLGVARTFQTPALFPQLTVYESLQASVQCTKAWLRRSEHIESKTEEVLALVRLQAKARHRASELSHGQKKLLEIGLALGLQPALILLDEPTAGLSPSEMENVIGVLKSLTGVTILIVEHNMRVVLELAQSIAVLHNGQVLIQGAPEEIQRDERFQRVYLQGRNA